MRIWRVFNPITNQEHRFDKTEDLIKYLEENAYETMSVWWEAK